MFTAVVVLPTPPFWFARAKTFPTEAMLVRPEDVSGLRRGGAGSVPASVRASAPRAAGAGRFRAPRQAPASLRPRHRRRRPRLRDRRRRSGRSRGRQAEPGGGTTRPPPEQAQAPGRPRCRTRRGPAPRPCSSARAQHDRDVREIARNGPGGKRTSVAAPRAGRREAQAAQRATRDPRRAAARADVDHRPVLDELGRGERVVHHGRGGPPPSRAHAVRPGVAQHRLEPALEPRVGRGHSGGAGATTTCRFGSVPSLEVTTSRRSAR